MLGSAHEAHEKQSLAPGRFTAFQARRYPSGAKTSLLWSQSGSPNALEPADALSSDRLSLKLRDVPCLGTELHTYQVDRLPQAPVSFRVAAGLQLGQCS